MAVTKYNESEKRSSSMFAIWDGAEPQVDFQKFINNEDIVDVVCFFHALITVLSFLVYLQTRLKLVNHLKVM